MKDKFRNFSSSSLIQVLLLSRLLLQLLSADFTLFCAMKRRYNNLFKYCKTSLWDDGNWCNE